MKSSTINVIVIGAALLTALQTLSAPAEERVKEVPENVPERVSGAPEMPVTFSLVAKGTQSVDPPEHILFNWTVTASAQETWQVEVAQTGGHSDAVSVRDGREVREFKLTVPIVGTAKLNYRLGGTLSGGIFGGTGRIEIPELNWSDTSRSSSGLRQSYEFSAIPGNTYTIRISAGANFAGEASASYDLEWPIPSILVPRSAIRTATQSGSHRVSTAVTREVVRNISNLPRSEQGGRLGPISFGPVADSEQVRVWVENGVLYSKAEITPESLIEPWEMSELVTATVVLDGSEQLVWTSQLRAPGNDTRWNVEFQQDHCLELRMADNRVFAHANDTSVASPNGLRIIPSHEETNSYVVTWDPVVDECYGISCYEVALDGGPTYSTTQHSIIVTVPGDSDTASLTLLARDFAGNSSPEVVAYLPEKFQVHGFQGLGDLIGGRIESHARSISADGSTVVGWSYSSQGMEAVRWRSDTGISGLGDLPGGGFQSRAMDTSFDGSVIVGRGAVEGGFNAFRWEDGEMVSLGILESQDAEILSDANGVSDDGKVIVGNGDSGPREGFFLNAPGPIQGLHDNVNQAIRNSFANDVSANGRWILGVLEPSDVNVSRAFRWSFDGDFDNLGILPGFQSSVALATTLDGSTVVGYLAGDTRVDQPTGVENSDAFYWTLTEGLTRLDEIGGYEASESRALGISNDGSVITGFSGSGEEGKEAVVWDRNRVLHRLKDFRGFELVPGGWQLTEVTGVSRDGSRIIGNGFNPNGHPEGWVLDLTAAACEGSSVRIAEVEWDPKNATLGLKYHDVNSGVNIVGHAAPDANDTSTDRDRATRINFVAQVLEDDGSRGRILQFDHSRSFGGSEYFDLRVDNSPSGLSVLSRRSAAAGWEDSASLQLSSIPDSSFVITLTGYQGNVVAFSDEVEVLSGGGIQNSLLVNGGFEAQASIERGSPLGFGSWTGDIIAVSELNGNIDPIEGSRMLQFIYTGTNGPDGSASGRRSELEQLIDLSDSMRTSETDDGRLTFTAAFNRVGGDGSDTAFGVRVEARQGSLERSTVLGFRTYKLISDSLTSTWQRLSGSYRLPEETDFLFFQIFAEENVLNDRGTEFHGHFADDILLSVDFTTELSDGTNTPCGFTKDSGGELRNGVLIDDVNYDLTEHGPEIRLTINTLEYDELVEIESKKSIEDTWTSVPRAGYVREGKLISIPVEHREHEFFRAFTVLDQASQP